MFSYAPSMTRGKPTESRRSNSPRRRYRGQPRRCLYHHGRPQDPRISPGQLLAKRARSPRRPNSRPTPKERSSRIARRKGIIVGITNPAVKSEVLDRRTSPEIVNYLLESSLVIPGLLSARNANEHSEHSSKRARATAHVRMSKLM